MPTKVNLPDGRVINFPDGMSPEQITAEVQKLAPAEKTAPAQAHAALPPTQTNAQRIRALLADAKKADNERRLAGASFAPALLGAVGGIVGGPLGAAAGGIVGNAAAQVTRRDIGAPSPETAGGQLKAMGTEGVLQGAFQGAGSLASAAAGKTARFLMNRAANVTDRLAREFPELSQTLIDHAITMTQGGYQRAQRLLGGFKAQANAALRTAEKKGLGVDIELTPELAESLKAAAIDKAMKGGTAKVTPGAPLTAATQRLDAKTKVFLNTIESSVQRKAPMRLTPTEADMFKSHLQRESKNAVYAARLNPNGAGAIETAAAEKAEYAMQLNHMLDDIADGYMASNSKARELIGAARATRQAVRPGKNLYMAMVRPTTGAVLASSLFGGPGGGAAAAAGAALGTPAAMSSLAVLAGNPVVQQFLKQLPRAVNGMVMASVQARSEGQGQARNSGR